MATQQAMHHATQRRAFSRTLIDQPLMQNVLVDLALEREASLWLSMRMAHALDQSHLEAEHLLARIGVAIGKYWICKRTPQHAYEAMECIGGSGVMETSMMPRLYREAPVNAIWEGSGNVQCLDVLRALKKSPAAFEVLYQEIRQAEGAHPLLDYQINHGIKGLLALTPEQAEFECRLWVDRLAIALQASLLWRYAPSSVAEAFSASRLRRDTVHQYGTLAYGTAVSALLQRYRTA